MFTSLSRCATRMSADRVHHRMPARLFKGRPTQCWIEYLVARATPAWRLGPMATSSVSGLEWSRRSEMRVFVVLAVGVAGAVATAVMAWVTARSPILVDPGIWVWQASFVASYVGVGAYSGGADPRVGSARWSRGPDSCTARPA